MRKRNGVYQYRGHLAFRAAARAHEKLFPDIKTINGGSRRMAAIYEALDKAYTDGIEDALYLDDKELARMRSRAFPKDRDV